LDTLGRECDRVISSLSSSIVTELLVIEVPRSVCTTSGIPCTPKTSVIRCTARAAVSVLCTCVPTIILE